MKESYINKMKSLLVAIIMIASVLVFYQVNETAKAADPNLLSGTITDIAASSNYGAGIYLAGTVTISWTASSIEGHGVDPIVTYNVTFARAATGGEWDTAQSGNLSAGSGNSTYYEWDTTSVSNVDGEWWVNVTASVTDGGVTQWINGTAIKFNVSNVMPGTPGVNIFQGGNHECAGATAGQVLDTNIINYEVDVEYEDFSVNPSAEWGSVNNYLFYPVYNGSDSLGDSGYNLQWKRYSTDSVTNDDTVFGTVTFDRAGLWVIDDTQDQWSDADFSTLSQFNSTVTAWFWVNTTTNYTLDDLEDDFDYNSTTRLYLTLYDENGNQPSTNGQDPVFDIRYDDNASSIFTTNKKDSSWTYNGYWVNNSLDASPTAWPGTTGFWSVGNYSVFAYRDTDAWDVDTDNGIQYYQENNMGYSTGGWRHYNDTYGANSNKFGSDSWLATATRYNWSLCGPWDPPEHNATLQYIRIHTGTPYAPIEENETVYYGFDGTINISLREKSGGVCFDPSVVMFRILNDDDNNVTQYFSVFESTDGSEGTRRDGTEDRPGRVTINKAHGYNGYMTINMTNWGRNLVGGEGNSSTNTVGNNGTWDIQIWIDYDGDRGNAIYDVDNFEWTEEWNTSVAWKLRTPPDAQWQWIDDDGAVWDDGNTDEVIPYIPSSTMVPLDVKFKIYDSQGYNFGDVNNGEESGICTSITECAENISISGNSLFTGRLSSFPGFGENWWATNVWTVPIIPTMSVGGGQITIHVDAYNTTITKTIYIGGENYFANGSVVTVTPSDFKIDEENKTLQISVQFSDDGSDMRALSDGGVTLLYLDDTYTGSIDSDICGPITASPVAWTTVYTNGYYEILFNTTQQTTNQTVAGFADVLAPRNLTVYVDGPGNRNGYALIQMKAIDDLEVHIEGQSEFTMMSGYEYDDFTISCDFAGNSTETPNTNAVDKNNFYIKIFDIHGDDVTGSSNTDALLHNIYASKLTGSGAYSFEFDSVYGLDAGTYYLYARNNTHTSEGNNATLIIHPVDVECDMDPFIWMSDDNISATFTITYNGAPANGTLVIDNMSDVGDYNKTWTNCSFDGSSDVGGNNSLEIDDNLIIDGVVKVHDITANALHPDVAKQYITFWFRPSESPGAFARASARINVEVPSVTPDPMYIPLGRITKVYCTATGRGETLQDVYIRLHGQGFNGSSRTDIDGRVAFSITPSTTGNISIDVGEINRTLSDTVVQVVAWVIDGSTVAEVDEGNDFTVTVVKEGTTDPVVGAAVSIVGIGTGTTDANGEVTFTAPEVSSDRTYSIKISAEGYAPDPDGVTITVINVPQLLLVIPDEVPATTTFDVAIADDTGGAIVGAMINFDGKVYTTGVNGVAKIKAPDKKGDYAIEATFGGYVKATDVVTVTPAPGIPGFELLTLIAALGVAFIILRRRKH